ncbi:SESQ1 protein, partial [Polypterus senegalus]
MKLHEKPLIRYATSKTPVDKEGHLYKKGERNTSYQKRWFILKGNLLFYYDKRSDREPLGVIVLEGCSVQLCESNENYAFDIRYEGPGIRTYKLAAEDQRTQEAWVKALLWANFSRLRMLVQDLERTYEQVRVDSGPRHRLTVLGIESEQVTTHLGRPVHGRAATHRPAPSTFTSEPLENFVELHERYRKEVDAVRQEWLSKRNQQHGDPPVADLVDLN